MLWGNLKKKLIRKPIEDITSVYVNVLGKLIPVADVVVRDGNLVFTLQELAPEG